MRRAPAAVELDLFGRTDDFEDASPDAIRVVELPPPRPAALAPGAEAKSSPKKQAARKPAAERTAERTPASDGARWLLRAAEAGLGIAQLEYGRLLLRKDAAAQIPGVGFSPKRAVFWLSKAAEQGQADAAYELGLIYRNPAFSQQNASTSTHWMGAAARLGHALGQYEFGAWLWRRRVSLGSADIGEALTQEAGAQADVDARAANWLSRARLQGVAAAGELLEKIVDPLPTASAQELLARRAALRTAAGANQWLALRLELAAAFALRKGEAFFFDPAQAVCGNILVVDVRGEVGKTRRRLFEIDGEGQAALLTRMQMMFGAGHAPEADLHGDYGRRHAQMDAFCRKHDIDEALFFSVRPEAERAETRAKRKPAATPEEHTEEVRLAA